MEVENYSKRMSSWNLAPDHTLLQGVRQVHFALREDLEAGKTL